MPQPAEVAAIRGQLLDLYTAAWRDIENRLFEIAADPPERTAVLRRRLAELSADIGVEMRGLDRQMRAWLQQQFPSVYELGAADTAEILGDEFSWAQHDRAAVQALARRTFDDLLAATRFVAADTKRFVREAVARHAARSVIEGVPAQRAGQDLASTLRRVFGTDPIAAVRYSNGARHSLADYADTVMRTTTATAYNEATMNTSRAAGVTFMECFDGLACGLASHDDPQKAHGLVLPIDVADTYPLAHPRCARSWSPRPDIVTAAAATAADRFTPAERAGLVAEENARATGRPVRLSRAAQARRQQMLDRRAARLRS